MFVSKKKHDLVVMALRSANRLNDELIAELKKLELAKKPVKKLATKAPAKKKETK